MIDLAPSAPVPRKVPPRPEPRRPPPPPPRPRGRGPLGTLVLLGFLATASGGAWLWQQQQTLATRIGQPAGVAGSEAAAALQARLDALQQRLVELEQRPAPAPLGPLEHRVGVLEELQGQLDLRPAPVPLAPLEHRLDALDERVIQLEQRPAPAPDAALRDRVAALEQRLAQFEQNPGAVVIPGPDVKPLEQRLAQAEQAISSVAARAARLQAIAAALEAGRPLGDIPGAPPALARFSTASPPTEAALRLAFPAAAREAAQASDPSSAGLSLLRRMWQQVQTLFTLRQGDKVLVGAPATSVLAQAQAKLDAGDLAGAVATLDQLDAAAARAIAGWRAQAQALLDARAALAGLAHS